MFKTPVRVHDQNQNENQNMENIKNKKRAIAKAIVTNTNNQFGAKRLQTRSRQIQRDILDEK